jgi:hypothetical protein
MSDADRLAHATGQENLMWMARKPNESKGSKGDDGQRAQFRDMPWVGLGFSSAHESQDKKSLDGEPYKDENGNLLT